MEVTISLSDMNSKDLSLVLAQLQQFQLPDAPGLSRLCNALAVLYQFHPSLSWCGIYLLDGSSRNFVLGPFLGKPACMIIPSGKGMIGRCAREGRTVIIEDVLAQPDHIACDADSRSEVVIPLRAAHRLCAVLDLDASVQGFFQNWNESDLEQLQRIFSALLADSGLSA